MPIADGATPGGDGTADDKSGTGADDGANKSGNGKGDDDGKSAAGDKGGKDDDPLKGKVVFDSQADVDEMVNRRVARATKKLEDDAKLTTEQKLQKERDDARAEVRERDVRDAFVAKADVSPAIAQRIFKAYRDELEIDDAGKAKNIDEVLKMAKKDMPQLFKPSGVKPGGGDGAAGSGGDGKPGGGMNAALRQMAGKTS